MSVKALHHAPAKDSFVESILSSFALVYTDALRGALKERCSHLSFVLTDPGLPDNPVVYASESFLHLTGYMADEVLGRNCRFLQGPDTQRSVITEIRDAICEERSCQVVILNYTKNRRAFWNLLHLVPLYACDNSRVVHFIGLQTPVSAYLLQSSGSSDLVNSCYGGAVCLRSSQKHCAPGCTDAVSDCPTLTMTEIRTDSCKNGSKKICIVPNIDMIETLDSIKKKAKSSMLCVLHQLMTNCKGVGVTDIRRHTGFAAIREDRTICSSLMLSLTKVHQSFVLANPYLPNFPIVHVNDRFLQLTGYCHEEVLGRNCCFLQGPETDLSAVQLIRESLNVLKPCTVKILNYRKNKTPFWNLLHICPVRNAHGEVVFWAGVQLEVQSVDVQVSAKTGGMNPHMKQLGAVGAIKVAVRSLHSDGLRRVLKSVEFGMRM